MKTLGLTLRETAAMLGAETLGDRAAERGGELVRGVSTDSRTIEPGQVFVALAGPHFDGHDHLAEALRKGALAVVSHRAPAGEWAPWRLQTPDTLQALGELAKNIRLSRSLKVAAVTGSNGKTTTKEMLAAIFLQKGPILATSGNFNNLVGLPLTLLRLEADQALAVLEMGMNHFGEIARLTEIARPDVGVITSVGAAHLEFFGRLSEVARAKGELYAGLPAGAVAVVNADEPLLVREARKFSGVKLFFGAKGADVSMKNWRSRGLAGQSFTLVGPGAERGVKVKLALPGAHNTRNALAAAAAALAAGSTWEEIAAGLSAVKSCPGRLAVFKNSRGHRIIDDSYNANPSSVLAGLEFLASLDRRTPKAAILGDMLELGRAGRAWHRQVGAAAAELGLDYLALVGPLSRETAGAALKAGLPGDRVAAFEEPAQAAAWLAGLPRGARIFVKGSNSMGLDRAVARLKEF